jgi:hypothetical protein
MKKRSNTFVGTVEDWGYALNPDGSVGEENEEISPTEDAMLRFLDKVMYKPKPEEIEREEEEE